MMHTETSGHAFSSLSHTGVTTPGVRKGPGGPPGRLWASQAAGRLSSRLEAQLEERPLGSPRS